VSAKDKATNKEQKITITASSGLTKEEAEKMKTEAEAHSEDDRRRMEEVEARNRLDGILYQSEKMLRENREKIAEADVKKAEEPSKTRRKPSTKAAWRGCGRRRKTSSARCTRSPKSCTRRRKRQDKPVRRAPERAEVLPLARAERRKRSLAM